MQLLLTAYGSALPAFLPMTNPPTTTVLMLGLAKDRPDDRLEVEARRAPVFVPAALLVAYFAGTLVLEIIGISLPRLQLAGDPIVTFIQVRAAVSASAQHAR